MKSSLKNMVLVLGVVTLTASLAVAVVDSVTREPIAQAQQATKRAALAAVLPPFDQTSAVAAGPDSLIVHTALNGVDTVGYAVETFSRRGYAGDVRLMVGFSTDGVVLNIDVLDQHETPGLGTKMTEPRNPLLASLKGKNPATMSPLAVRKDGGQIDALTAATISSRAYVDAVARAQAAFADATGGVAAVSGATKNSADHE